MKAAKISSFPTVLSQVTDAYCSTEESGVLTTEYTETESSGISVFSVVKIFS
jgi:hypothetical protein